MIAVLTVAWRSDDFVKLLVESVRRTGGEESPIVVVANDDRDDAFRHTHTVRNRADKTHGGGINAGLKEFDPAKTDHVLILDADCHMLSKTWQADLLGAIDGSHAVTVPGSASKPLRPAFVFMRLADALTYDWRATPGYRGHRVTPEGFDVGVLAYHRMTGEGKVIRWMDVVKPSRYHTLNGEEYGLDGVPLAYHHWHGTHLAERAGDYPGQDLFADRDKLFRQARQGKTPLMA